MASNQPWQLLLACSYSNTFSPAGAVVEQGVLAVVTTGVYLDRILKICLQHCHLMVSAEI